MNDNKNLPAVLPQSGTGTATPFKGYTIEEIRHQRALVGVKKDFCKAKLFESMTALKLRKDPYALPKPPSKTKFVAGLGKTALKLFTNMNTLDYILMGISLVGTAKKGLRLIRGKKKK